MSVSSAEAATRFANSGFERSGRYEEGTKGKGQKWDASKARAKINYGPAMQAALADKSYEKGLEKANGSDYEKGVRDKGVANWGVGMSASSDRYQQNIQPFAELWDKDLPTAKGPRRSAANMKRMTENVQRFIDKKR